MPTRHELWCVTFGCVIGLAVGGSLVWAIQSPPPEWYRLEHVADWFVASFTGLLAYVTFRLVMSTNRLWKESERQYKLSEDTARRQLRAYVHPREASLVTFERGLPLYVMIPLFNTGQTPAHDLNAYFELAINPLGDKYVIKVTSAFD